MKFLSQINVNTEYTLPIVDGSNGQVLATDGNGTVYWGSISAGATNLDGLSDVEITSPQPGQILNYSVPLGGTVPVWRNITSPYATLASPAFTGIPTAPTAPTATNTTQIATTAFVKAQGYLSSSSSINDLGDVTISTVATGQILQWSGTQWVNATLSTVEYVSKVQHLVKCGVAVTKGQAVYVTSADGTNMIVGLASNATEGESSKVIGIAASNGAINDQIFVVTEGLVAGLNTSTATAGDAVWLGTGGNLIFGLLNKPVAPANLVYLGVVTRVQQNNGEIFVNVQNGFELKELHDVLINGVSAGQLLRRDSDGLWKNWTPNFLTSYTETDTLQTVTTRGATTNLAISANGVTSPNFTSTALMIINADTSGSLLPDQGSPANKVLSFRWQGSEGGYIDTNNVITFAGFKTPTGTASQFLKANGTVDSNTYLTTTAAAGTYATINYVDDEIASVNTYVDNNFVPKTRTLTINGTSFDLSANRSWTISTVETDTLATVTGRGDSTSTALYFAGGSGEIPALHIRSGGNSWSEGLAIHPSTNSGYALSFYRTRAAYTDQTNTWAIGNLGDPNALNHFGLLRKGLTGGIADRSGDAIFTVNPTGAFKFGFNPYVGGNVIWHAGNDGAGSGLDADLIDGVDSANILWGNARGTNDSVTTDADGLDKTGFYTSSAFVTRPDGVENWMYIQHIKLYNANPQYQKQIGYDTYDDRMWVRTKNANTWSSWKAIITSDNISEYALTSLPAHTHTIANVTGLQTALDGKLSTSGKAADSELLDGIDSSSFLRSDANDSFSGNLTSGQGNWIKFYHSLETDSNDGKIGSGIFDTGLNIVGTQTSAGTGRQVRIWGTVINNAGNVFWHAGNDGAGSGLDADLLDGQHGSYYAAASSLGSYLPLSGGTMTGDLTLKYSTADSSDYNGLMFAPYSDAAGLNDYIIKAASDRGVFGRKSFGWHVHTNSAFGVYSNGWEKLFGVEGGTGNTQVFGSLTVNGSITESSSIRYKKDIVDIEHSSSKIELLRPVRYKKIKDESEEIGLIAEDVAELFPEVVKYDNEGRPDGVNYSRLSVILLKAVQELTERVNKLENK